MLVAVSGDTTYFAGGSGDSAGVFSVPSTGGAETKMASSSAATFLAVVSGCLVFDVFDYGNIGINGISLTNGTATQLVGTLVTAYCDGTSVYYIDSSALYSINPAAPLTVTTLGSWTSGTVLAMSFAMFNGAPYLNSYDRIVSTNLTDSTTSPVWRSGMAGDYYTGTIRGPFAFPSARGPFFIFDTAPLAHVMFLPTDGTPVRRLGSFNPQCAAALVADASNVYVGTCRHIVSLTY